MAKRKRNYAAEYKRRIDSAVKRGFTRSQARGHANLKKKVPEVPISAVNLKEKGELDQKEYVAMLIEQGYTQREAYTAWFYS